MLMRTPTERVRAVVLPLVVLALAGCASGPAPLRGSGTAEAAYVGVFTGEFVDGRPLYRFPRIEVFGSRSSIGRESSAPDGS